MIKRLLPVVGVLIVIGIFAGNVVGTLILGAIIIGIALIIPDKSKSKDS